MRPTEEERQAIRDRAPAWLQSIRRSYELGHFAFSSLGAMAHLLGYIEELVWERDRLRAQFIKHRTTTHKVAPSHCETCRESDAMLGLP